MRYLMLAALAGLPLAACQQTSTASRAPTLAPGVPIAVESVAGAPDSLKTSFSTALSTEASARQLEIVDPKTNPRYRVRGYLAAQPTEDGQTALAFVWDVFDAQRQRAQRMQGATIGRRATAQDAWSGVDQTTVAKAASDSMDAIAQFLAGQNEVAAATASPSATATAAPTTTAAATAPPAASSGGAVERAAAAAANAPRLGLTR